MPALKHGLALRWCAQQTSFIAKVSSSARPARFIGGCRCSYSSRPRALSIPVRSHLRSVRQKSCLKTPGNVFKAHARREFNYSAFKSQPEPENSLSSAQTCPTSSKPKTDLAVLGGGITGLSTALAAAKNLPNCKVTIYEKEGHLGGWLRSTRVDVGDGQVIFESGPRSLRPAAPNGELCLRLIESLGILDDLLVTPKSSPAAKNRFIYYPDHLVRVPGPGQRPLDIIKTIWSESAFNGSIRGLWKGITSPIDMRSIKDESVGSYVSRRLGIGTANNLVSALFHGIYAGDIWQLSAKELVAQMWAQEKRFGDLGSSMMNNMFSRVSWRFCDDVDLLMKVQQGGWDPTLRTKMQDCSVFTFKNGLQTLADGLVAKLKSMDNVTIKTNSSLLSMTTPNNLGRINITTTGGDGINNFSEHTHVISTLSSSKTSSLITDSFNSSVSQAQTKLGPRDISGLKALAATKATNVAVVNFYFRTPSLLRQVSPTGGLPASLGSEGLQGFGYLIPQSIPFEQNPERALGVIFDSDISPNLSSTVAPDKLGTRLTVMLGGHWWDDWSGLPSEPEAISMAQSVLARHLGIHEDPVVARATVQESCIPQYTVGHGERLSSAHDTLQSLFGGRLKVAGSWYTGVGVNDCIRAAHEVVESMQRSDARERTGLERFAWGRPMVMVRMAPQAVLEVLEVDELGARQGYFRGVKVAESSRAGNIK